MQMDTTKWILLIALLFLLLRKSQAQSAAAGASRFIGIPGTPGATSKTQSLLQRILGGTNTTKTTAGIGSGSGGSTAVKPGAGTPARSGWRPPARQPQALIPSSPLNSLIPSVAPAVWTPAEVNYPGWLPTIPSDSSNIFLTPEDPASYENVSHAIVDWGAVTPAEQTLGGIINQTPYGYEPGDPTYFNPVDTQTIDTSGLGGIAYLPTDTGSPGYASGGGYAGDLGGGGYAGDLGSIAYLPTDTGSSNFYASGGGYPSGGYASGEQAGGDPAGFGFGLDDPNVYGYDEG